MTIMRIEKSLDNNKHTKVKVKICKCKRINTVHKINIYRKILSVCVFIIVMVSALFGVVYNVKADVTYSWDNLWIPRTRYQSNRVEGDSKYGSMYKGLMDSEGWSPAPVYKLYYKLDGGAKTAMSYDSSTYTDGEGGYEIMLKVDGTEKWLGKSSYRNGNTDIGSFYDCWHNIQLSNLYFTPREINGDKFLQINIELNNIGSTTKTFSLATSGDIQIADDDNAAIQFLGNGFSMSNRYCTTSQYQGGRVKTATLNVYARNAPYVTDADAVHIGIYADRRKRIWDNNVLGDIYTHYNFRRHDGNTGFTDALDSSFSIAWNDRTIEPGEKKTYSYIIGVGDYKAVNMIHFNPNTENINDYSYATDNVKNRHCWVTYDSAANNKVDYIPVRKGYTFDGWWTTIDDSGVKIYNADGSCNKGTSYWNSSGRWQGFTSVIVYAHWKPDTYIINFNQDGATSKGTTAISVSHRGKSRDIIIPEQKYNIRYHTGEDEDSAVFKTDIQENAFAGYYNSNEHYTMSYADPVPVTINKISAINDEDSLEYSIRDYSIAHTLHPFYSFSASYVMVNIENTDYISAGNSNGIHISFEGMYTGNWIIKLHDYEKSSLTIVSNNNGTSDNDEVSINIDDMNKNGRDTYFALLADDCSSLDIIMEADAGYDILCSYTIELLFVSDKEYPDKTKAIYNPDGVMQYDYNITNDSTLTAKWDTGSVYIPSTDSAGDEVIYWRASKKVADGGTINKYYYPSEITSHKEEFSEDTDLYPVYEKYLQDVYMRFQNEDGTIDDWNDKWGDINEIYNYGYKDEETLNDIDEGYALWQDVRKDYIYTFDTGLITRDFRWKTDAYEMPEVFDDGTPFSYTVTGDTIHYITVYKKAPVKREIEKSIIKAASTMYKDTLIRRTTGDENWYNIAGRQTINRLKEYNAGECIQVWVIDNNGNITRE